MNRRDFFKTGLCTALGLVLPFELASELVIVDIKFTDGFRELFRFSGSYQDENGQWFMEVTMDTSGIWNTAILVDDNGREWKTDDMGETWRSGLMSFSLATPIET